MEYILESAGLTKEYDEMEVVTDVNMHIKRGEVYGFLGRNGAGKSTVMKMILNLVQPTEGTIYLYGQEVRQGEYEYLKRVGTIIETPVFYEALTGKQNLQLHCRYMGYPNEKEISKVMSQLRLERVEKKAVKKYSVGMKQRLAIARAIITKPEFLILDEPVNGLDPNGIKEMRQLFQSLSEEYGTTILISSHILSEIEHIANTIGVLSGHHLVKEVSMEEIHKLQGKYLELCVDDVKRASTSLECKHLIHNYKIINANTIRIYDAVVSRENVLNTLMNQNIEIISMARKSMGLEEYFLSLTEEAL